MEPIILGAIAVLAGVLIGFWIGRSSGRAESKILREQISNMTAEKGRQADAAKQLQDQVTSLTGGLKTAEASLAAERIKSDEIVGEREKLRDELQAKIDVERKNAARISQLEADLRNERENAVDKMAMLEKAKQTLANQFEVLAGEILERKSKSFSEGNQTELGNLLSPLREQLKEFREKVEKVQVESSSGVTKLETLIGTLGGLNQQLAEEARSLSTALRGSSKAQGDWGELIARNLLEKAGLREGEQFRVQETFDGVPVNDDERRKKARPDVIVNLPAGRHLVIDSKVSLNGYADLVNAATDEERAVCLKRHLASVRGHVTELADRRYHKLQSLDSPDFVVMFIPIEPAFLAALHQDEGLWSYAYERGVLLVGPTTLLFIIRIVDNLWQQEKQAHSVQEVMDRGAELYDKFVGFVSDMESIGKNLHSANENYASAMKKLGEGRGNLIRRVEMLKELGIRPSKSLPQALVVKSGVEQDEFAFAAEADQIDEAE